MANFLNQSSSSLSSLNSRGSLGEMLKFIERAGSLTQNGEDHSKLQLIVKIKDILSYLNLLESSIIAQTSSLLRLIKSESCNLLNSITSDKIRFNSIYGGLFSETTANPSLIEEIHQILIPDVRSFEADYTAIVASIKQFYPRSPFEANPCSQVLSKQFQGLLLSIPIPTASLQLYNPPLGVPSEYQGYSVLDARYFYCKWWQDSNIEGLHLVDTVNRTRVPIKGFFSNNTRSAESPGEEVQEHITFIIGGNKIRSYKDSKRNLVPLKCRICSKITTEYFHCSFCISEVCMVCTEWMSTTKINPLGMVCYRNHPLRENENTEEFYRSVRKEKVKDFLCDGCLNKYKGKSAQCRNCKVDYCERCIGRFGYILENIGIIKCGKKMFSGIGAVMTNKYQGCCGTFIWKPFKNNFKCAKCKKFYNKSGSFCCCSCTREICIVCTSNIQI